MTLRRLEFCVGHLTKCTSTLGRAHSMWLSVERRSASIRRTSNPSGSRSSMGQMPTSSAQLSGLPRWECSHRWAIPRILRSIGRSHFASTPFRSFHSQVQGYAANRLSKRQKSTHGAKFTRFVEPSSRVLHAFRFVKRPQSRMPSRVLAILT